MQKRLRVVAYGRVQGVMYRDFALHSATTLNLFGFVRNLPDGTVEAVAEGEETALQDFLSRLKVGSRFSRIDDVVVEWSEATGEFSGFEAV